MKNIIAPILTVALLTTACSAMADYGDPNSFLNDVNNNTGANGWLVAVAGGANYKPEQRFTDRSLQTWNKAQYKWGWNSNVAIGYKYMNWRLEGAVGYLRNNVDQLKNSSQVSTSNASGNVNVWTGLLNLYFDFNTNTGIVPFFGVGAGGVSIDYNSIKANGIQTNFDDRKTAFAYQGILGIGYQFTSHFRIAASYHYLRTPAMTFTSTVESNGSGVRQRVRTIYDNNLFNVGLSVIF